MKTKICTNCKIAKNINEFYKQDTGKDGIRSTCKICSNTMTIKSRKIYYKKNIKIIRKNARKKWKKFSKKKKKEIIEKRRIWRLNNKEIVKEMKRKWDKKNPKKVKESAKKNHAKRYKKYKKQILKLGKIWRDKNKEKVNECARKYRLVNKEKINKRQRIFARKYYKKNRRKCLNKCKKWREENKEKWNQYIRNKMITDPKFKTERILRGRLWKILKNNIKSDTTMSLLGHDIDFVMYHIQNQFKKEMTWDNHGNWHIDHIIPCASFDLRKAKEQRKCFHYTNLRPLWAKANMIKSDRLAENLISYKWTDEGWVFKWK